MVRIKSLQRHRRRGVADACTSAVQMVFSLALTLATFILVVVVARFMAPVFLYFFQKFTDLQFSLKVCLGFRFRG